MQLDNWLEDLRMAAKMQDWRLVSEIIFSYLCSDGELSSELDEDERRRLCEEILLYAQQAARWGFEDVLRCVCEFCGCGGPAAVFVFRLFLTNYDAIGCVDPWQYAQIVMEHWWNADDETLRKLLWETLKNYPEHWKALREKAEVEGERELLGLMLQIQIDRDRGLYWGF